MPQQKQQKKAEIKNKEISSMPLLFLIYLWGQGPRLMKEIIDLIAGDGRQPF